MNVKVYDDDLIMPRMMPLSEFEHALKIIKDKFIETLTMDLTGNSLDFIHAGMSWRSCFHKDQKLPHLQIL